MNRGQVTEALALLTEALADDGDELADAFKDLATWCPEGTPEIVLDDFKTAGWAPGSVPFFTEGYLYPLMGKDDARSILGLIRTLLQILYGDDYWQEEFSV